MKRMEPIRAVATRLAAGVLHRGRWAAVGVVFALAVAVTPFGVGFVRDRLPPKRFVAVEPGFLYRSGSIAPGVVREVLEEHRIRRIVWLLHYEASRPKHRAQQEAIEALGITRVNLSLRGDGTGSPRRYVEAIAQIVEARRAGEAVLVQCAGGARRSGAVVALYELLVEGRTPEQAYRELARFGSPVVETPLLEYLNLNMGQIAAGLAARGVIAAVPSPLPLLRPPYEARPWERLSARWLARRGIGPL